MGHIKATAVFYNAVDYVRWVRGELVEADVRRVEVEALVDTGATYPALPGDLIEKLGLTFLREVDGEVAGGPAKLRLYGLALAHGRFEVSVDLRGQLRIYLTSALSALPTLTFLELSPFPSFLNLVIGLAMYLLAYLTLTLILRSVDEHGLKNLKRI